MQTDDFIAGLTRTLDKPVRPATPWRMFASWLAIVLPAFLIVAAWLDWRVDFAARLQEPLFVLEIMLLAALVLASALSSFWHAFPDLRQQPLAALAPLPLLLAYAGLLLFRALVPAATAEPLDIGHNSLDCVLCITLFAPLPAGLMLWQIRRGASTTPRRAALLALLVAGATGHLLLKFVEANDDVLHLLTSHLLPILVLGGLGWLAGRKILAW